jgi:hypothetical protein
MKILAAICSVRWKLTPLGTLSSKWLAHQSLCQ